MRAGTESVAAIARAVGRTDYFRRSPFSVGGRGGHKEWHHFCILGDAIDLLVNFSLSDDIRPGARRGTELARLTLLLREAAWDGDVDTYEPGDVRVGGGRVDLTFGPSALRFADGVYTITAELQDRPIRVDLTLTPVVMPSLAPNIPLPDGPPLHWVIVPRLHASGRVVSHGRTYELDSALAYHDHNFGHFLWGHAFSWVWGFALPTDAAVPWSLAFVRLANRLRTRALAQGFFLWKDTGSYRVFRDHDLELRMDLGHLQPRQVFKVPRIMALLCPDAATDVPRWVEMHARGDGDEVWYRFDAHDLSQVVIPSETDLSVTIINEVTGRSSLHGTIGGERIEMEGRAVCEFLGS